MNPYRVLEQKRFGQALSAEEIQSVASGAADGSWDDAQLGAFLMAVAIHGLDDEETRHLTLAMLDSGVRWRLVESVPGVVDKHSTGGVGDKVSLILGPLLAACGVPVAMLTGRALGHTGGTADKLDSIPGLDQALDRKRAISLLESVGLAVGIATDEIAPADQRLYRLRDRTGTVSSLPLVIGSILSKKLATGTGAIVFDVKIGNGAFFPEVDTARGLAQRLVNTSCALGCEATAVLSDMSQPLGSWVGHTVEVEESLACLEGRGDERLTELTLELSSQVAGSIGSSVDRETLENALADGSAREAFDRWAAAQGADTAWLSSPTHERAPVEQVIEAPRAGVLAEVDARQLGLLLAEAAVVPSRSGPDPRVALEYLARTGNRVERGQVLAKVYLREESAAAMWSACFTIADEGEPAGAIVRERVLPS